MLLKATLTNVRKLAVLALTSRLPIVREANVLALRIQTRLADGLAQHLPLVALTFSLLRQRQRERVRRWRRFHGCTIGTKQNERRNEVGAPDVRSIASAK